MITFPKAKINFGLKITGKRPDGYHNIETIFYPVSICDALEFVIAPPDADSDDLVVSGIDIKTGTEKNLVIRAIKKLRENFSVPWLRIHLHKAIPTGAGLGGGSSDGVCMLKTIRRSFNLSISDEELLKYALELGSDCPFFLDPVPSFATGRGEVLTPVDPFLEKYHIVLLNPGIKINTRDAYINTAVSDQKSDFAKAVNADPKKWKHLVTNDFEDYVFKLYPQIGAIKKSLYSSGAIYSSMTGSGSTVYGLFRAKPVIPEKLKGLIIYEGIL